jgi:hypothetical protein
MTSKLVCLRERIHGRPLDTGVGLEEIPKGSEISVLNWEHENVDSLVEWSGRQYIVHRETLMSFADPL